MRSALQTLLARPYALSVLRNAVYSDSFMFCRCNSLRASNGEQARVDIGKERRGLANTHQPLSYRPLEDSAVAVGSKIKEEVDNAIECVYEQQNVSRRSVTTDGSVLENLEAMEIPQYLEQTESPRVPELTPLVGEPSRKLQLEPPAKADGRKKSWEGRLSTFEQYQYEADLQVHQGLHLVDDPVYAEDWKLWLELIGFRKRHYGTQGTMAVFENIIQRKLAMPTRGTVGKELWHQLFQAGFHDHEFLEAIVAYAIELMQSTGRFWSRMYRSVIAHFLRTDPRSAYRWHVRLKQIFPPALKDYQVLFKLSLDCNSNAEFRNLYTDLPLPGLYQVAIPGLCELQRYSEALKWHYLLCMTKDPPSQFHEIKPLLAHLAHIGDSQQLETIIKGLNEAQVSFSGSVDFFIRKRDFISREIMNRRLGEVHGIGAKHLSDGFCARLFATRLFSIDTVINGLQMMAAEVIGPLSLREIASRDDCDPIAIRRHIERLNDAGVTLDQSPFSTLVRNLAVEGNHKILRSLVDCDLHPDIFKDYNLQERLLAQYYDEDDPVKVERTLAMLTVGCNEDNLPTVRMNVILRSQITLRRKEAVLSMLELMKQMGIPISSRSSRHLRVCWLSRRQVGRNPGQTRELSVIILASQRTMQSGRFVPIIAWREILRRLGMSGRLTEFENLVIWLVDWYSSPAAKTALPYQKLLPSNDDKSAVKAHIEAQTLLDKNRNPQRFLNVLFTTSAQHAIVSWGFQKTARDNQNAIRRFYPGLVVQHRNRLDWTWGLNLLRTLRERGVPIQKFSVARVCKQRLNALFGPRTSKRRINRRMKRLNDKRALALEKYTAAAYVRKMKEIWGSDLFRNQDVTKFLQEDWQRPVKSKNRSPPGT